MALPLVLSLLLLLLEMQPITISTATIYLQLPAVNTFLTILIYLISALLAPGFVFFCMEIRRGVETPYAALFDGFEHAGKLIWANVVIKCADPAVEFPVYCAGACGYVPLPVAIYNIIENPSLTVTQAIELSKVQTYGMKGQLLACGPEFSGVGVSLHDVLRRTPDLGQPLYGADRSGVLRGGKDPGVSHRRPGGAVERMAGTGITETAGNGPMACPLPFFC